MNRTKPRLVVSSRSLAHLNQPNLANPPKEKHVIKPMP